MHPLESPIVRAAVAAALTLGTAAPVLAQNQSPQAAPEVTLQEVVVTGSRIAAPNAKASSPIQVVSSAEIQATGKNDISDILNQLPQIFNNDLGQDLGNRTSGLSTPGGVATADLRGLGPNRTLVLIDGRRLGQGSPNTAIQSPAPDLDQIPEYMLDRVEVVTGGASAVYGSDAIAGVVNFILKKDFQGLEVGGQWGMNWHDNHATDIQQLEKNFGVTPLTGSIHDGRKRDFHVIAGTNFADGVGNVTAWFGYLHADPVAGSDRDWSGCQLKPNATFTGTLCTGTTNSNQFVPGSGPNAGNEYAVLGNEFIPWGSQVTVPPSHFNSQPYIYMTRGDDRYTAGFNAHYDVTDWAKPYMQFTFMNDRTEQIIAPSGLFANANPLQSDSFYTVNCGNPFLSANQAATLGCSQGMISAANQADPANQVSVNIGRRNIEGGGRVNDFQHTNYRAVLGSKGDFADAWSYDAYAQFYYTDFYTSVQRYMNFQSIANSLLVTGTADNPQCISGPPCIPYNIFQQGKVNPAALDYLYTTGTAHGATTLRTFHADITGQLGKYGIKLPTANDGVAVNFGVEHRNENVQFQPDTGELSGLLSGFGSASVAINNSQAVDEQFIEARIPLVQDKTWAKDLILSPGFRRSDYSVTGSVNTYKFDVQWAPLDDFRLRGSYQRAIRAPSLIELYNPQLVGLIQGIDDPCAGHTPSASEQQCLNTVSAAQAAAFKNAYENGLIPQTTAGQLSQLQGGNPKLQPEKAKSYSAGIVFSPTAVPNLTGSLDYWKIDLEQGIGTLPANAILSGCMDTGNPLYCSQIVRSPTTFSLNGPNIANGGYLIQTNVNVAAQTMSGLDLQANYKLTMPRGLGTLMFSLNGSYLLKNSTTPYEGAHTYDCAGLYGSTCQTVTPRWRHNLRTTWQTPWMVDVSANWRFIGKVGLDNNDPDPTLFGAVYGQAVSYNAQLPNYNYIDLSAAWHAWKGIEIRGGVNNVLDKDPPAMWFQIAPGGANTYSTYDQMGREMYINFTARF